MHFYAKSSLKNNRYHILNHLLLNTIQYWIYVYLQLNLV